MHSWSDLLSGDNRAMLRCARLKLAKIRQSNIEVGVGTGSFQAICFALRFLRRDIKDILSKASLKSSCATETGCVQPCVRLLRPVSGVREWLVEFSSRLTAVCKTRGSQEFSEGREAVSRSGLLDEVFWGERNHDPEPHIFKLQ